MSDQGFLAGQLCSRTSDALKGVPSDDPRIGTILQGRYRVLDAIAAGGMGVVYRGERVGLQRSVAIKFLHGDVAEREQFRKRFEIEARAMSRLSHPHCVSVIDFGVVDVPYFVMDYVTGRPLGKLIEEGPIPIRRALHITRQLLAGLAHAHSQGIVHRDIKPDNLILDEALGTRDHLRILDFGLAKLRDFGVDLTSGLAIGTPSYMAPEQTFSEPVDTRTDLYAVGIVLYEMLTGTKPFKADSIPELIRMQREITAVPIRTVRPDAGFSTKLEGVVLQALAKRPAARFQTASEMAAALDDVPEASSADEGFASTVAAPVDLFSSCGKPSSSAATPTVNDATGGATPAARRRPAARPRLLLAGGLVAAGVGLVVAAFLPARNSRAPASPPPTKIAAPAATPRQPPPASDPQLDDVRAQIDSGRSAPREAALKTIARLRKQAPSNAELAYLEGNAFSGQMWWSEALASYRDAIRLNSQYREDPRLINNMIGALMSSSFHHKGARFLRDEIGAPAVPLLDGASREAESTTTRRRAAELLLSMRR
jgi:eukaryotic-like serine/threonine-protein kinase